MKQTIYNPLVNLPSVEEVRRHVENLQVMLVKCKAFLKAMEMVEDAKPELGLDRDEQR